MAFRGSDLVTGALVGYTASRTMDVATTAFYARQDEASKRREQELAPEGGVLLQLGRQLAGAVGREVDDASATRIGIGVHRGLGVGYGILAAALVRRGWSPWAAGLTVATGAFVIVDEGTSLPLFTAYPVVSHLRGVVGHATHGLTTGALLALLRRR